MSVPPLSEHLAWTSITVDGRKAGYGAAGQGPPLVFLHGWGLGYKSYRRALQQLVAQGNRVFAPTLPGFGGTARLPEEECTIAGYARWVLAFMDAVGIDEPVTLVGHSFGGGVAIRTAYEDTAPSAVATQRVQVLVLINSIGGSAWAHRGVVRSMAERPLWDWGLHLPRDLVPLRQVTRVIPVMLEDVAPNIIRNPRTFWRVGGIARHANLTHELEALKARRLPIVILWGSSDRVIPDRAFRELCAAAGVGGADATCVTVDGKHGWLLADPQGFAEVMTNVVGVAEQAVRLRREADDSPVG